LLTRPPTAGTRVLDDPPRQDRHRLDTANGRLGHDRIGSCGKALQTFLPYSDFERSARVLDPRRLGKQRVEVIQVVRALTLPSYGWRHHPVTLMWSGFEEALGAYGLVVCRVWRELGSDDTFADTIGSDLARAGVGPLRSQDDLAATDELPTWAGRRSVAPQPPVGALAQGSGLVRPALPDVPDDVPYVWPVRAPGAVEAEQRREVGRHAPAEREAPRAGGGREGRPAQPGSQEGGPYPSGEHPAGCPRTVSPDGGRHDLASSRGLECRASRPIFPFPLPCPASSTASRPRTGATARAWSTVCSATRPPPVLAWLRPRMGRHMGGLGVSVSGSGGLAPRRVLAAGGDEADAVPLVPEDPEAPPAPLLALVLGGG